MKNFIIKNKYLFEYIFSIMIFSFIGVSRKNIHLESAMLSAVRALLGVATLILALLIFRKKFDFAAVKKNLPFLFLSGIGLSVHWIFLFEAYSYLSVATASLCYYTAPIIVIALSPIVFNEKLTLKKVLCIVAAALGVASISGAFTGGLTANATGIFYGLACGVFYAFVMILNKKIVGVPALDKTIVQLLICSVILLPYALIFESNNFAALTPKDYWLLLLLGTFQTGFVFAVYFGTIEKISVTAGALFSYIDPVMAVCISVFLLKEPADIFTFIGVVLIIGSAVLSEINFKIKRLKH